jgi:hypothetical protein
MAAKFFTGLPLDGPDPECVGGEGELALTGVAAGAVPRSTVDHSKPGPARPGAAQRPTPVTFLRK